jgi:hypothetical protein
MAAHHSSLTFSPASSSSKASIDFESCRRISAYLGLSMETILFLPGRGAAKPTGWGGARGGMASGRRR